MKPKKINKKRLMQLAEAIDEVCQMPKDSVTSSIRRVLRLLELCPWLEEQEADHEPK
jgi:hypothetical protein